MAEESYLNLSESFGGENTIDKNEMPVNEESEQTQPENVEQQAEGDETAGQTEQTDQAAEQPNEDKGEQPAEQAEEGDKFFEMFNKRYSAEIKGDDDISSLLESKQKVAEYLEKEKVWSDYETERNTYKEKIAELEKQLNPLEYFSSPEAYVAEQLRKQYPDKNPVLMQEIATADLRGMDDMDILVKQTMLDNPDLENGEAGAREYLDSVYGIDRNDEDFQMTIAMKNRIKIDANKARKDLATLKSEIELPKVMTEEERAQAMQEAVENKKKEVAPYREKFEQFDTFKTKIGDNEFKFDVPNDFKEGLADMFDNFFIQGNQPINEENLQAIQELRDAFFLKENFAKIYEVITKEAITKEKAKMDEMLHNEAPENRGTATDQPKAENDYVGDIGTKFLGL